MSTLPVTLTIPIGEALDRAVDVALLPRLPGEACSRLALPTYSTHDGTALWALQQTLDWPHINGFVITSPDVRLGSAVRPRWTVTFSCGALAFTISGDGDTLAEAACRAILIAHALRSAHHSPVAAALLNL